MKLWSFAHKVTSKKKNNSHIFNMDEGRRNPGTGRVARGDLPPPNFFTTNIFLMIKRNWIIYSFENWDSVSYAQIGFKYNISHK